MVFIDLLKDAYFVFQVGHHKTLLLRLEVYFVLVLDLALDNVILDFDLVVVLLNPVLISL